MPLFIYVTRDKHINHVRCGHAGAVPDPKATHQLLEDLKLNRTKSEERNGCNVVAEYFACSCLSVQ